MSSVATMGPDTPVTVKVTFDGTARKVKIPLRDMVPRVLEEHIRTFLHIPADKRAMIERYSDSAAAYVMLDSTNMAVYKQLYRAAKAKSKLKLRVSLLDQSPKVVPKPVSVEDDEQPVKESQPSQSQISLPLRTNPLQKTYDANLLSEAARLIQEQNRGDFENRLGCLMGAKSTQNSSPTSKSTSPAPVAAFAVFCNSCEKTVPEAHYHCSTCEDGDFDLCQSCVDQGITCHSDDHWLIKRTVVDGVIVKSSTETMQFKPKPKSQPTTASMAKPAPEPAPAPAQAPAPVHMPGVIKNVVTTVKSEPKKEAINLFSMPGAYVTSGFDLRTCNNCLQELPSAEFVHCGACEDFDLCQPCFSKDEHGHHPMHQFVPAVEGTNLPDHITMKMAAGRNKMHLAICDGCDKNITGVRHKCLDCPDWDYCAQCVVNASFVHPKHRFAPIYEPLALGYNTESNQPVHMGICCDGPLCSSTGWPSYIRGVRYKCAVCHDVDFCASCEANPSNSHNKTHPLIKFKTPVRHVSVTTTGEHQDGKKMVPMGDRSPVGPSTPSAASQNSMNPVQTVVNVAPEPSESREEKKAPVSTPVKDESLQAQFVRDTVPDGSIMAPNAVFQQTWTLRNKGEVAWPAGCAVTFVGGDYMGHVDSTHPAGISELVSASKSTVCYSSLAPGQEFQFTVLLRSPARPGKFISYWRLATEDGERFGDRLWCEVNVRVVKSETKPKPATPVELVKSEEKESDDSTSGSTMIFPKLEKESPSTSIHQCKPSQSSTQDETSVTSDALDDGVEDDEWDASDDGFLTDEEYDILDASDEEYLEEQQRKMLAK